MDQSDRNREEERVERDLYVILLHVYTLTRAGIPIGLTIQRIDHDLGFDRSRGALLVRGLIRADYLQYSGTAEGVTLTRKGVDYIEHAARRRRSLRSLG